MEINLPSLTAPCFKPGMKHWYDYFFTNKPKDKTLSKEIDSMTKLYKLYYPFLEDCQIMGKVLKKFGIPNVCGQPNKGSLRSIIEKDKGYPKLDIICQKKSKGNLLRKSTVYSKKKLSNEDTHAKKGGDDSSQFNFQDDDPQVLPINVFLESKVKSREVQADKKSKVSKIKRFFTVGNDSHEVTKISGEKCRKRDSKKPLGSSKYDNLNKNKTQKTVPTSVNIKKMKSTEKKTPRGVKNREKSSDFETAYKYKSILRKRKKSQGSQEKAAPCEPNKKSVRFEGIDTSLTQLNPEVINKKNSAPTQLSNSTAKQDDILNDWCTSQDDSFDDNGRDTGVFSDNSEDEMEVLNETIEWQISNSNIFEKTVPKCEIEIASFDEYLDNKIFNKKTGPSGSLSNDNEMEFCHEVAKEGVSEITNQKEISDVSKSIKHEVSSEPKEFDINMNQLELSEQNILEEVDRKEMVLKSLSYESDEEIIRSSQPENEKHSLLTCSSNKVQLQLFDNRIKEFTASNETVPNSNNSSENITHSSDNCSFKTENNNDCEIKPDKETLSISCGNLGEFLVRIHKKPIHQNESKGTKNYSELPMKIVSCIRDVTESSGEFNKKIERKVESCLIKDENESQVNKKLIYKRLGKICKHFYRSTMRSLKKTIDGEKNVKPSSFSNSRELESTESDYQLKPKSLSDWVISGTILVPGLSSDSIQNIPMSSEISLQTVSKISGSHQNANQIDDFRDGLLSFTQPDTASGEVILGTPVTDNNIDPGKSNRIGSLFLSGSKNKSDTYNTKPNLSLMKGSLTQSNDNYDSNDNISCRYSLETSNNLQNVVLETTDNETNISIRMHSCKSSILYCESQDEEISASQISNIKKVANESSFPFEVPKIPSSKTEKMYCSNTSKNNITSSENNSADEVVEPSEFNVAQINSESLSDFHQLVKRKSDETVVKRSKMPTVSEKLINSYYSDGSDSNQRTFDRLENKARSCVAALQMEEEYSQNCFHVENKNSLNNENESNLLPFNNYVKKISVAGFEQSNTSLSVFESGDINKSNKNNNFYHLSQFQRKEKFSALSNAMTVDQENSSNIEITNLNGEESKSLRFKEPTNTYPFKDVQLSDIIIENNSQKFNKPSFIRKNYKYISASLKNRRKEILRKRNQNVVNTSSSQSSDFTQIKRRRRPKNKKLQERSKDKRLQEMSKTLNSSLTISRSTNNLTNTLENVDKILNLHCSEENEHDLTGEIKINSYSNQNLDIEPRHVPVTEPGYLDNYSFNAVEKSKAARLKGTRRSWVASFEGNRASLNKNNKLLLRRHKLMTEMDSSLFSWSDNVDVDSLNVA